MSPPTFAAGNVAPTNTKIETFQPRCVLGALLLGVNSLSPTTASLASIAIVSKPGLPLSTLSKPSAKMMLSCNIEEADSIGSEPATECQESITIRRAAAPRCTSSSNFMPKPRVCGSDHDVEEERRRVPEAVAEQDVTISSFSVQSL